MRPIYLDNNSTSFVDPAVARVMTDCLAADYANPASQHRAGQRARRFLEDLRTDMIAGLGGRSVGSATDYLIFTSGGTESNNLALFGLAHSSDGSLPENRRVLISAIEHPSISHAADQLVRIGFEVEQIAVDQNGVVDLDDLSHRLRTPTRLVSVMLANNETGVIQPISEIARTARKAGALVHCDAVQAIGKMKVDFRQLQVDAMTFTAHKFHGPRGIGGLLCRTGIHPFPQILGGFQQQGFRPGTEDVVLAAGFHKALQLFLAQAETREQRLRSMRDRLQQRICDECQPVVVVGGNAERVPQTLNLAFPGINRQQLLMAADLAGLAISTGSACASGSSEPSPVLMAMQLENEIVEGAVRLSISAFTTDLEIDRAADRIIKIIKDLRRRKTAGIAAARAR